MNKDRVLAAGKAAFIHLLACGAVAMLAAALVFGLWFPHPYASIEGGRELFILVIAVDVVCGPLLTLVVFNRAKPRAELVRDLSVIALTQIVALVYGLGSVALARPVFLAFEADRFRVVSSSELSDSNLEEAQQQFRQLSFRGPRTISVHVPQPDDADYLESLELSFRGLETALRPSHWRPYEEQQRKVQQRLGSLEQLKQKQSRARLNAIDAAVSKTGMREASLGYLPVVGRNSSEWIAIVSRIDARVVGFIQIDGF